MRYTNRTGIRALNIKRSAKGAFQVYDRNGTILRSFPTLSEAKRWISSTYIKKEGETLP